MREGACDNRARGEEPLCRFGMRWAKGTVLFAMSAWLTVGDVTADMHDHH
jgi:hypothetical protein